MLIVGCKVNVIGCKLLWLLLVSKLLIVMDGELCVNCVCVKIVVVDIVMFGYSNKYSVCGSCKGVSRSFMPSV